LVQAASVSDYRAWAQRKLPRLLFDYVDGGSFAEQTLRRNTVDFADIELRQRVLRDAADVKTAVSLFGQKMAMPLVLAPVGMAGMLARRGEVQAARAANAEGVPFCLSTVSICPIREVASGVGAPPWFQLYMLRDRGRMRALFEQAREAGAPVLMFTVDLAVPGTRYRDARSGFSAPPSLRRELQRAIDAATHPAWLWDVQLRGGPHVFGNLAGVAGGRADGLAAFWGWIRENFDPSATWRDLEWVRQHWPGPIVLKGILDAEDAGTALSVGADGIVVSNHGGRQLDGAMSSIRALPRIVEAVAGRAPVLMDGGVRSGVDIVMALALGADACMIGRAWAYALAADGERGVAHLLRLMRQELEVVLALCGCPNIKDVGRDLLAGP
jgi:L-lactate dehydrogenase (cytochrome)